MFLKIRNLDFRYSPKTAWILRQFKLDLAEGEQLAIVGPSGCGKSTLLRLIAGLEEPQSGTIEIAGRVVNSSQIFVEPEKRNVGLVFQDYALFPHLNILENVRYGLSGRSRAEKNKLAQEMLEMLGLSDQANKYPHELSGGQQQRVAVARSLCPKPQLLLMDEPFSNLDTALKERIRFDIKELLAQAKITTILVTHDLADAEFLSTRVIEF